MKRRKRYVYQEGDFTALLINCKGYGVGAGSPVPAAIMRNGLDLKPTFIYGSECLRFRFADIGPRASKYEVFQPGGLNSSESGVLLAMDRTAGYMDKRKVILGSKATSVGSIDNRYIVRARFVMKAGHKIRGAAGHPPPPRSPFARTAYLLRWAKVFAGMNGGDTNSERSVFGRIMRATQVSGGGVLFLTVPPRFKVVKHESVDVGSDHPAELITLRKRKGVKK